MAKAKHQQNELMEIKICLLPQTHFVIGVFMQPCFQDQIAHDGVVILFKFDLNRSLEERQKAKVVMLLSISIKLTSITFAKMLIIKVAYWQNKRLIRPMSKDTFSSFACEILSRSFQGKCHSRSGFYQLLWNTSNTEDVWSESRGWDDCWSRRDSQWWPFSSVRTFQALTNDCSKTTFLFALSMNLIYPSFYTAMFQTLGEWGSCCIIDSHYCD